MLKREREPPDVLEVPKGGADRVPLGLVLLVWILISGSMSQCGGSEVPKDTE